MLWLCMIYIYIYILVLEIFIYYKHQETNGLNPTDPSPKQYNTAIAVSDISQHQPDPRR